MLDNIEQIKSFERQLIFLLNLDGWALQWTGEGYESFDADGYDDSGNTCVLELKFRKKAYRLKMLEKYKHDKLQALDVQKKYYGVVDSKGLYIFDLENITDNTQFIDCPNTTVFNNHEVVDMGGKRQKEVYLLGNADKRYFYNFNFKNLEK
jgi:hypothetical protein